MYSRAVWALAALELCFGASAAAFTAGIPIVDEEPVDRLVNVTTSDLIAIQSFYRSRPGEQGVRQSLDQQLWGFTADSSLPVSAAKAQLEYSVWMPPGAGEAGFADDSNRLIRLRLNDHHRYLDYGANFFAVGEAFAQKPLARERLNAVGLPGPGSGAEFWLTGRLPEIALEPRFRRLEKTQGTANLLNETFGLSYGHGLWGTRLSYLLESSRSSTWFEEANTASHDRQAAAATVRMRSPDWSLFLKSLRFDEAYDTGRRETGSLWEMGGTLKLLQGLRVSPLVSSQRRDIGAAEFLQTTSAGLTLHTTWIEPVAVHLQLQRNWRDTLDGPDFGAIAADLKLRAPLRLWERVPHSLVMTASMGYRDMEGLANPAPEEGLSFRLTFDFQPGGS